MHFTTRSRSSCLLALLTLASSALSSRAPSAREIRADVESVKSSGVSSRDQLVSEGKVQPSVGILATEVSAARINALVRHWLRSHFLDDDLPFRLEGLIETKNQWDRAVRPRDPVRAARRPPIQLNDGSRSTAASDTAIRKASRDVVLGISAQGIRDQDFKRRNVGGIHTSTFDRVPVLGPKRPFLGLAIKRTRSKTRLSIASPVRKLLSPDGVMLDTVPSQTVGRILFLLSVIVQSINPSYDLRTTCLRCMANATGTDSTDWGMYDEGRVGDSLIQMSFFVNAPEHLVSIDFPRRLALYIGNHVGSGLTQCVRSRSRAYLNGSIDTGLLPTQQKSAEVVSNAGSIAPWIVGAIIGGVAGVVLIVAFILIRTTTKKTYPPELYSKNSATEIIPDPTEDQEIKIMA